MAEPFQKLCDHRQSPIISDPAWLSFIAVFIEVYSAIDCGF